jgi:hypothetical protein
MGGDSESSVDKLRIKSVCINSDETMNISQCDVSAVLQANQWKLVSDDRIPIGPDEDEISC